MNIGYPAKYQNPDIRAKGERPRKNGIIDEWREWFKNGKPATYPKNYREFYFWVYNNCPLVKFAIIYHWYGSLMDHNKDHDMVYLTTLLLPVHLLNAQQNGSFAQARRKFCLDKCTPPMESWWLRTRCRRREFRFKLYPAAGRNKYIANLWNLRISRRLLNMLKPRQWYRR